MKNHIWPCAFLLATLWSSAAEKQASPKPSIPPELRASLDKLVMPGVRVNLDEWCVDVETKVCMDQGLLELVLCTKDSKEHESILVTEAKPSHIHTALLLIGAKNGSPAIQQAMDAEMTEFRHVLPTGDPIRVSLVWKEDGKVVEKPVSDFIAAVPSYGSTAGDGKAAAPRKAFPTDTFLFAGSVLAPGNDNGAKRYVCDEVGNVISISTFGDELLCLPEINTQTNELLTWVADPDPLPAVGSKVTLRLRLAKQTQ